MDHPDGSSIESSNQYSKVAASCDIGALSRQAVSSRLLRKFEQFSPTVSSRRHGGFKRNEAKLKQARRHQSESSTRSESVPPPPPPPGRSQVGRQVDSRLIYRFIESTTIHSTIHVIYTSPDWLVQQADRTKPPGGGATENNQSQPTIGTEHSYMLQRLASHI